MALAGMQGDGGAFAGDTESMFEHLGRPPRSMLSPSADEMAEAMRRVQVENRVTLKAVRVRTYDLGDEAQVQGYENDIRAILEGASVGTHRLLARIPAQFVQDPVKPRYIAHLEWLEFELSQRPVRPVGGEGVGHAQQNRSRPAARGSGSRDAGDNGGDRRVRAHSFHGRPCQ